MKGKFIFKLIIISTLLLTYIYLFFIRGKNMTTKRFAMAVRLKNEKRDFYIKNHANVWPEILEELKKVNVKNYSIFLKEDFMFGYLEYDGDNFDEDMSTMQKIPIVDKWTKLMIDCFNPFPNNEDNESWVMMDEIFHLD